MPVSRKAGWSREEKSTLIKYEDQYSYDIYRDTVDIAEEWFEQVKAQEEGGAQ